MKSFVALVLVAVGIGLLSDPGIFSRLAQNTSPSRAQALPALSDSPRIFAGGVVEGAQREVALQFEITGRIAAIPVVEGQTVAAGELLAQLDDRLLIEQLVAAQQQHQLALAERDRLMNGEREESREVVRAAARLAAVRVQRAEADKLRAEKMYARQAMAQDEFDRFRFEYDLAVAEFQRARSLVTEVEAAARRDDLAIADARIRLAA
jgi:HlyD family secretion protein